MPSGTGLFAPTGGDAGVEAAITNRSNQYTLVRCATASIPSGTAGYAIGCELQATDTGILYTNTGSTTSCTFTSGQIQTVEVDLNPASIISGTSIPLVAAPGTGKYIQFISATMSYKFATAAYTGGGNVTIALGTTSLTGLISAANSLGKASSNIIQFSPLSTAGVDLTGLTDTALNINVATGAFTNPGTAAGTAKVFVSYIIQTA